ncbi:MAG: hypothetical protein HRU28_05915 [Rhizobiales bacterium]|nr:hypothetical protein [Hyphomicrobiales bacterium]
MPPKQRDRLGAGPKREASANFSDTVNRPKRSGGNEKNKHFNKLSGSANDDIAHAAQMLEEIKGDASKKPIFAALVFSVTWVILCVAVSLSLFSSCVIDSAAISFSSLPILVSIAAVLFIPCVLSWGVAVFLWRARELHQISLSLAYTALHLTQPEDMAGESIATIGQAVRREVAAMGDGIDRAISRATTLENKFRNEVGNIQGFYKNNENIFHKIIADLQAERDLMAITGDDLEARLPKILDSLKESSFDFSRIVQSADQRFTALAKTADTRLDKLGTSIADKTNLLKNGLDKTIDDIGHVTSILETGTSTLSSVTDKLSNVGLTTTTKLDKISGNFTRQTTELGYATTAILKANEEINVALQSRHEHLSSSAESLLTNAEKINNLLSSFATVIDKSFINAEDRSANMQAMIRSAAQESADILQSEMGNIRDAASTETQKLLELLRESSFAATSTLRNDIENIMSGSQQEVQHALGMLLKESQTMGAGLKDEANAITEMMHREMQLLKETAVGDTEASLLKVRQSHEQSIANIIVRIEEAGKKLSGTADNLGEITGRLGGEMETTRHNLAEQVANMPNEAKQALSEMQSYIDDQVHALSELARTVGGLGSVVSTPIQQQQSIMRDVALPVADNKNYKYGATERSTAMDRSSVERGRSDRMRSEKKAPVSQFETQPPQTNSRLNEAQVAPRNRLDDLAPSRRFSTQENVTQRELPQYREPQQREGVRQREVQQQRPVNPVQTRKPEQANRGAQNKWEMPELLSRASDNQPLPAHLQPRQERVAPVQPVAPTRSEAASSTSELHSVESLNAISLDLARALDHEAPDQLWARYRNGERNVFTRRLYTLRGQKLFDEVSLKYQNDGGFKRDVDRYIGDFEDLLTKVYEKDRDSMLIDTYLSSETGKIYLMLAHASGRLD